MTARGRTGVLIGILVAAGALVWFFFRPSGAVSDRRYATHLLADYLRVNTHPKGVLVIGNPFSQMPGRQPEIYHFQEAAVAGLRDGFGSGTPLTVVFPKIRQEILEHPGSVHIDPRSSTPLSFVIQSEAFDELIAAHPACDLVITLIGLPVDLGTMKTWNTNGPPRFAMLLPDWRVIGGPEAVEAAFRSGKLVAAVIPNPTVPETAPLKSRYAVISSNNVPMAFMSR